MGSVSASGQIATTDDNMAFQNTQSLAALPANYDDAQSFTIVNQTPVAGITFSDTDDRLLAIGMGPNGPMIRAASNDLDLTQNNQVLVPDATVSAGAVNLGQLEDGSIDPTFGSTVVADATADNQAVNLGQVVAGARRAVFTGSGTWTVPAGITQVLVSGCAAGGGGGSGNASESGGGGGGYGQWVMLQAISVTAGDSLTITIGAAGAGGSAAGGAAGGDTTIAAGSTALLTLTGGGGGTEGTTQTATPGGTGWPYGGAGGWAGTSITGAGASGPFGGGGARAMQNMLYLAQASLNAAGYGAGGGGAPDSSPGGNGAPGLLILEW